MKIITIHGIQRQNRWYELLPTLPESKDYNLEFLFFDYGYFSFYKFIRKKHRLRIIELFCKFYNDNIKDTSNPPSVIAHSFGTYVVYQAMKKYNVIRFDKIIFCGSILNSNLDFRRLISNKQFRKLKNDHGSLEWYLKHTKRIIDKDCGEAGKIGFKDIPIHYKDVIENNESYKSHSEYFLALHMQKNWLDFLISDLTKFEYNLEILKPNIIERIYENIQLAQDPFTVNTINFFVRIDAQGNYFAKYQKEGVNETQGKIIEHVNFSTTADGFHSADKMELIVYDKNDIKLHHNTIKDINHQKKFEILLTNPVKHKESILLKFYFCWYNTINLTTGDTDHLVIYNILNVSIALNFPFELVKPKVFIVKDHKIIEQHFPFKKTEVNNTFTYTFHYNNLNNNDGAVFYFEGSLKAKSNIDKKILDTEFSIKGRKDRYIITKATESDIRKIYDIEIDIEHGNAASEETLLNRRNMFNDGFLVVKRKSNNRIVGYLESLIWNEKKFERFEDISNFPLHLNITGKTLYIIFLAVDKNFRRNGIAAKMLEEIEKIAKEYKIEKITLVAKDQLTDYYSKLGYQQILELPNFLKNKDYNSILMEKNVKIS